MDMDESNPLGKYFLVICAAIGFSISFLTALISKNDPSIALLKGTLTSLVVALLAKVFIYVVMMNVKDYYDKTHRANPEDDNTSPQS